MGYRVAVVGATGAVGREMLKTLVERNFPVKEVAAVASARSTGSEISFGEKTVLKVQNLDKFDFTGWDIGLFSPGGAISAIHAPRAAAAGAIVIDNTSAFPDGAGRSPGGPGGQSAGTAPAIRRGIVANPNCSTIQMVVALKPLHDRLGSGGWSSRPTSRCRARARRWTSCCRRPAGSSSTTRSCREDFTKQIAFNCIPQIDKFMEDGSTKEEWKMAVETRKILDPDIAVTATCVRVPCSSAIPRRSTSSSSARIGVAEARDALRDAPGRHRHGPSRRRRLHDPDRGRRRGRRLRQPYPHAIRPSNTASPSGASPTISARVRR